MRLKPTAKTNTQAWLAGVVIFCGLMFGAARAFAGDPPAAMSEYQVKALCLLNFAKYVDWPETTFADTNSPIQIGVIGENKFGDNLKNAMEGRCIDGHKIAVVTVEGEQDWSKCQILFISGSEKKRQADILKRLHSLPVLTVGESDQFMGQGGAINFVKKDAKIRFEVNLDSARAAGLNISSKLLSLADTVQGKP